MGAGGGAASLASWWGAGDGDRGGHGGEALGCGLLGYGCDNHPQISSLGMTRLRFRSHAVGCGAMPLSQLSLGADWTASLCLCVHTHVCAEGEVQNSGDQAEGRILSPGQ